MVHVHSLEGCTPTPLAYYLKALAILRLIAKQVDAGARGRWRGDRFELLTRLDRDALIDFFTRRYQPSPLVAPWNGGSGFYSKDNTKGIAAIEGSHAERFAAYRAAIAAGKALTEGMSAAPKKEAKAALQRECRTTWRGSLLAWLDAALVLDADGSAKYPALLGTGGNDGRLDFTNNFMQRLAELFLLDDPEAPARPHTRALLSAALFGDTVPGLSRSAAIGQFLPGGAGGANQGQGYDADSLVNPWDFVLMLEGALVFRAALSRRATAQSLAQASAPFALRGSAIGYGSAAGADESARGEQWMPLWSSFTTHDEVEQLFAEGRGQLGTKIAQRPVEFARALARLGVARGVDAFERYGYIERNGQSNLAVPLGRWKVGPRAHEDLLSEIEGWVDRLRAAGRDKLAPASLASAARRCEAAMLACCRRDSALHWQALLIELAAAEQAIVRSPRFSRGRDLRPLPRLSGGWITAAGNLEASESAARDLRLALSLASLHGAETRLRDSIRHHFLPLDRAHRFPRFSGSSDAIERRPEVVATTRDLVRDAPRVLRRRASLRNRQASTRNLGLVTAAHWSTATLADVAAFIRAETDDARCLDLATACMALDWYALAREPTPPRCIAEAPPGLATDPGALYGLLRLAVPFSVVPESRRRIYDPLRGSHETRVVPELDVSMDPAVLERLLAGDVRGATSLALARVRAAGLRPKLSFISASVDECRRVAASLIFPMGNRELHALVAHLCNFDSPEPSPG